MVCEQDILERLPALLGGLPGLRPQRIELHPSPGGDAVVHLAGRVLVVEAKANARAAVLSDAVRSVTSIARRYGEGAVPVLAVPFMGDVGRRICEEAGVAYVDLSGNADIKAPPLVIHVQGRTNAFKERGRPSSVFAPKSSRVARILLLDPTRWWSQRAIAESGELGTGYVSRICRRLEEDGLIERNLARELRPRDPKLLLRAWEAEYRFGMHEIRRGHVSARSGEELAQRVSDVLRERGVRHALTGLPAAWRMAPFAAFRLVAVYIADRIDDSLLSALSWHEESAGANLWLVRPKDAGVLQGSSDLGGMRCVCAVQAYLDLQGMPERSQEAADHVRKQLLPWA